MCVCFSDECAYISLSLSVLCQSSAYHSALYLKRTFVTILILIGWIGLCQMFNIQGFKKSIAVKLKISNDHLFVLGEKTSGLQKLCKLNFSHLLCHCKCTCMCVTAWQTLEFFTQCMEIKFMPVSFTISWCWKRFVTSESVCILHILIASTGQL